MREGRHLAILGEFELDRSCDLLHRLGLRGGTDAADRKADVDGRTNALIEQVGLKEDLTIGDRDHVGRNIGRSEEHTSELQSLMRISYAVFCLKKKKNNIEKSKSNMK